MSEQEKARDMEVVLQAIKQAQGPLHEACSALIGHAEQRVYDWVWEAREDIDCAIAVLKGDSE